MKVLIKNRFLQYYLERRITIIFLSVLVILSLIVYTLYNNIIWCELTKPSGQFTPNTNCLERFGCKEIHISESPLSEEGKQAYYQHFNGADVIIGYMCP